MKEAIPAPSSPTQNDIPDLSVPQYFVGGSPPGFESMLPLPGSFLGCISDIQVNQESYNLLRGQFWSVQKSCMNKVKRKVRWNKNPAVILMSYFFIAGHSCRIHGQWISGSSVLFIEEDILV